MQKPWKKSESGQAPLMIILLGMAFTLGAWVMISTYTSVESNLDIRAQDERLQLEQVLMDNTDCEATMGQIGLTDAASITDKCTTSFADQTTGVADPTFVPLINTNGDIVTESYDQAVGKKYGKSGNWSFRAGCYASGATTCLLVHSAKPWEGSTDPQNQFQPRALMNLSESWKKLPNSPWSTCCWGPPSCQLNVSPNPVARDNTVTFTLDALNVTSATMSTSDSTIPAGTPVPFSPGFKTTTHAVSGAKTATAVVTGPGGTSTCSVNYLVVDPPLCTLNITAPAAVGGIHQVTSGQPVTLSLTWTNSSSVESTPTVAEIVAFNMPPAPDIQMPLAIPFPLPSAGAPTQTMSVVPPVGRIDQGIAGFRGKYVVALRNATGSFFCETPNVAAICPLGRTVGFYEYLSPPVNCTTCDHADYNNPGAPYTVMTNGFSVAANSFEFPNLQTVYQQYSASRADYWTGATTLGSVLDGYNVPATPLFYAYNNTNEAPGLIPVKTMTKVHPATEQDEFVFPADSRYSAEIAAYQAQGYTQGALPEFYACPVPGNYTPVAQSPGPGPGPGPAAPGAGPAAPGPGASAPGPGTSPSCATNFSGWLAYNCPQNGTANEMFCGNQLTGSLGSYRATHVTTATELMTAVSTGCPWIVLDNDIDMNGVQHGSFVIPSVIDGRGHAIRNLNQGLAPAVQKPPLFHTTRGPGSCGPPMSVACDIIMDNAFVDYGQAGGFAQTTDGGTFRLENITVRNSTLQATVGRASGGIAGILRGFGYVKNMTVTGTTLIGAQSSTQGGAFGLVESLIADCSALGNTPCNSINGVSVSSTNITFTGLTNNAIGGVIGTVLNASGFKDLSSSATITSTTGAWHVGGIIGMITGPSSLQSFFASNLNFSGAINVTGNIAGFASKRAGGIIGGIDRGSNSNVNVTQLQSSGTLNVPNMEDVGGLIGYLGEQGYCDPGGYSGTATIVVNAKNCVGGAVGREASDCYGAPEAALMTGSSSVTGISNVNRQYGNTGCP